MLFKLPLEFGFRSGKCALVNCTNIDINGHLSLIPGANCKFIQLVDPQISCGCTPGYQARKCLHTGTVEIDSQKFFHLKLPYNSYMFKIYEKHLFLCCKTETLKITVLALFKQENLQ